MAGLDPAIQPTVFARACDGLNRDVIRPAWPSHGGLDGRVTPGHDGGGVLPYGVDRLSKDFVVTQLRYPVLIEPLSEDDGGGFLATVPDLPGCMSDGETPAEAIENVQDAIEEWLDLARKLGREIPTPSKVTALA